MRGSGEPFRIAVFASGSGSNFQAIVDRKRENRLDASIEMLICDRPKARVVERAQAAGIPVYTFRPKEYDSRQSYEQDVLRLLREKRIELIVLAGYMRLITPVLLEPFEGRMINIHPALLPSFPGINGIRQAIEHGVKVSGVTVHFVDGGMDTGPIIAQHAVEVRDEDTEASLGERIHHAEHALLPEVIGWIGEGRVTVEGRKVKIRPRSSS